MSMHMHIVFTFTSIGNVRVALVALVAHAGMSCTIISVVPAEAVAAAAHRRGPIAVARRVVDPPVQHRGKASASASPSSHYKTC
jgi:hypothetical protein